MAISSGKRWTPIKPGQIVDIIAPGYLKNPKEVEYARSYIESIGLVPRIPDDIVGEDLLHSNKDDIRAAHLLQALQAPDSSVVWCLRGGYGTAKLMPSLASIREPKKRKLLIGYSDISFLHHYVNHKWDWISLHAPVLGEVATNKSHPDVIQALKNLLFGISSKCEFAGLEPLNDIARNEDTLYGSVAGGNLSVIQTTLATSWQFCGKKHFVVLEDIGEHGYSVDRMLTHLSQAGIFDKCKAILLGDFTDSEESDGISLVEPVIRQFAARMPLPVLRIPHIGHGAINQPLPLNSSAILRLGEQATLSCEAGW